MRALTSLLLVVVLAGWSFAAAPPARLTAEQKDQLAQSQRWLQKAKPHFDAGEIDKAIAAIHTGLALERSVFGHLREASLPWLVPQARLLEQRDRFADATKARQELLRRLQELHGLGDWRVTDARLDLEDTQRLARLDAKQRAQLRQADEWNVQVFKLWQQGRSKEALPLAEKALATRQAILGEKHRHTAVSWFNLGAQHQALNRVEQARRCYDQALRIQEAVLGQKHPDYARSLNNLAALCQELGDYKAALPLYQQTLQVWKNVRGRNRAEHANSLNNLALLYQDMGDYKAALPLFQRALQIDRATYGEKHPNHATRLSNLATLYRAMGDDRAALPLLQQALVIRKAALGEKHPNYAGSLNNLAALYTDLGDHKSALRLFLQALEIKKAAQGEKHPDYALGLNNLALFYQRKGDHKAALPLFQQALEITKAALGEKHPAHIIGLNNLAWLYEDVGDYRAALPLYQEALRARKAVLGEKHPDYALSVSNLAALYQAMKQSRQAARLGEQALAITRTNLVLAASVQSERQQLAAAGAVRSRLDFRLSLPDPPMEGAAASYRHVLAWKGAVFGHQRQRRQFARLLASSRSEVQTLVEQLQQTTRRLAALTLAPVDSRTASSHRQQAEVLTQRKEDLESRLSRLSATFRAQQKQADLTAPLLQKTLPAGTALVDFLFYTHIDFTQTDLGERWQRRLSAWVVRPDQELVRIDLGPAEPIEQAATAWRQALTERGSASAAGRALHKELWQPVAKHLEGAKTVLVSPDGVLGTVPFAALPGRKEGTSLIEDVAAAVVPVPQVLPELLPPMPREKRLKPSLLVVGDVSFDSTQTMVASAAERSAPRSALQNWAPLPATQAEAAAVNASFTSLFKAGTVTDLRKGEARKTAVRQALVKCRYAHLATHGFFAPAALKSALADNRPDTSVGLFGREGVTGWHPLLLSGLVLAGANKEPKPGEEDGILTALEVSEMDLGGLELAVLSACETGLGRQAGGEGLLGLQRAFAVAGCRSVIASLWSVSDPATSVLMEEFYEQLWRKKQPPLQALRQAQLAVLKDPSRVRRRAAELRTRLVKRGVSDEVLQARGILPRAGKASAMPATRGERSPEAWWAAFVLSGDWR
jgi:CHAT domain-containing protein/Tfp pilus assembly protein PilF